jgi:predicted AAA+ superfamily ATPase
MTSEAPWEGALRRLEGIMARVEALLGKREAPPPDPAIFHSHRAFRWERVGEGGGRVVPIPHPHRVDLASLVGIDGAKLGAEDEIHPEEAVSEKLSLSDRFGMQLGFYRFDQETYLAVVKSYARRLRLPVDPAMLREEALRWALAAGSRSGRTAKQFINDLAGRLGMRSP